MSHKKVSCIWIFPPGADKLRDAWGGYLDYVKSMNVLPDRNLAIPFCKRWLVVDRLRNEDGSFELLHEGYKLRVEARESEIDSAVAGEGLFVTCSDMSGLDRNFFRLEAGKLIDLSVYGPMRMQDIKSQEMIVFKNFIFGWATENWTFDGLQRSSYGYDITDDVRGGALHEAAAKNIIVRCNETDGKTAPTVRFGYDAEGLYSSVSSLHLQSPFTRPRALFAWT